MPRPNVAPRPVCRYYATQRCFAGPGCHYLHADPTYTPYEQNKTCRFFARGFCKRGNECWFAHERKGGWDREKEQGDMEPEACGVCFEERPALYGLLSGCSHAFCLKCIRQWRDPEGKGPDMQEAATHKTCPMCRNVTPFITPSSIYYSQGDPRKKEVIEQYKQSMARVPCRYFSHSKPEKRFCPFGRDCFYQHLNADGTPYIFAKGVDAMMQKIQRRRAEYVSSLQGMLDASLGVPTTSRLPGNEEDVSAAGAGSLLRALNSVLMRFGIPSEMVTTEEEARESAEAVILSNDDAEGESAIPPLVSPSLPADAVHSEDPRLPANASRASELVIGDFAWMMEERSNEGCVDGSGGAQ